jgi:hypothetical protein
MMTKSVPWSYTMMIVMTTNGTPYWVGRSVCIKWTSNATNARDWKPSRPNWTAPARDTQRLKRSRTWYQPVSHWKWFGCNALTIYESGWEGYHRKTYCHVINVNEVDEHDEKKHSQPPNNSNWLTMEKKSHSSSVPKLRCQGKSHLRGEEEGGGPQWSSLSRKQTGHRTIPI